MSSQSAQSDLTTLQNIYDPHRDSSKETNSRIIEVSRAFRSFTDSLQIVIGGFVQSISPNIQVFQISGMKWKTTLEER